MAGERTYDEVVAENAALRIELEALRAKVTALEKLIGRNSSNSSIPPSADPLSERRAQAQNRAARRATKRKPGKQPGAEGRHLAQVADPDVVLTHTPTACEGCGADLADAPAAGVETRQVFDLPEPGLVCTEHRAQRRRCSCGKTTTARFPTQATAPACHGPRGRANGLYLLARQHIAFERAAEAMADLFGVNCSTGLFDTLYSQAAEGAVSKRPACCPASPVPRSMTASASTSTTRTRPTRCATLTCCATSPRIEQPQLSSFLTRYDDIVASALAANPEPASGRKRNTVERESYNLAVAFGAHRDAICRFATDLRVPFTNNQAERDLRMAKLHRKISGCFRAPHGAERLAAVRSYISTAAKHGIDALDVLVALFAGTPWTPTSTSPALSHPAPLPHNTDPSPLHLTRPGHVGRLDG